MTNKEAIKRMWIIYGDFCRRCEGNDTDQCESCIQAEAFNLAIDALEEQRAKNETSQKPCKSGLISRSAVEIAVQGMIQAINSLPDINVSAPKGKWKKVEFRRPDFHGFGTVSDGEGWMCTKCRRANSGNQPFLKFCPGCGADMRDDVNERYKQQEETK